MKRKKTRKQNARRAGGSSSIIRGTRFLYNNWKTACAALVVLVVVFVWKSSFLQMGGQVVYDSASKVLACSGFVVGNILVEGREQTSAKDILTVVGVKQGDLIFNCDPAVAKDRLDKLPWVKSATVQRRLPDTIYIRLAERQPMAIWQRDSKFYLIDDQGEVLDGLRSSALQNLLVVTGERAPQNTKKLIVLLSEYPEIKKRVKAAVFISGRRWDLVLDNKVRIKMPEDNIKQALEKLVELEKQSRLTSANIASIDIRLPDRSFLYIESIDDDKKNKGKLT